MSYKTEFGLDFNLGFDLSEYPLLIDKSWHNDVCPSFYFRVGGEYFVLWVDFEDPYRREYDIARYAVVSAENLGCDESPDIVCGENGIDMFRTDDAHSLAAYLNSHIH